MAPLDVVAAADVPADLHLVAADFRPKVAAFRTLLLCDFYVSLYACACVFFRLYYTHKLYNNNTTMAHPVGLDQIERV